MNITTEAVRALRAPAPIHRDVTVVAHRGASGYAPENTVPAVRLAVEQRADLVEVDVQQTRDGVLVVIHDTTLERTTDVARRHPGRAPWRVADFTYREIRGLDAGAWFGADFAGVRVPTLAEVLDILEPTRSGLLLEVKTPRFYPGIGRRIAKQLASRSHWRQAGRRLIVQSFDRGFSRDFAALWPTAELGVLGRPWRRRLSKVAGYADLVNPQFGSVDAGYLRRIHELGLEAYVWTVDDPRQMRATVALGADGVITNRPDVLRDLLDRSLLLAS